MIDKGLEKIASCHGERWVVVRQAREVKITEFGLKFPEGGIWQWPVDHAAFAEVFFGESQVEVSRRFLEKIE